ncbi:hypothetical protein ACFYP4_02820 [Streptomyces sp. NPDC005551]|uniref:hypothetical protein n=1 Tax=Streptomyces sp. NPDC005551 TaxID=3364725 RepID=UPI00367BBD44
MALDTREAAVAGPCTYCPGYYEAGDMIAQPNDGEVMCPQCVTEHRELNAA